MTATGKMPWDGMFDNLYPSKKTSIRKVRYIIKEIAKCQS